MTAQKDLCWPVRWRRVCECGFVAGSLVEVRAKDLKLYPANLKTCGSVWVCAVCGAKIRVRRGLEVEAGAAAWTVMHGGSLAMVTFTVRHFQGMSIELVLAAVAGGWRLLRQRKEYRALRKLLGGTIKSLEVTKGPNGWHVHIHLLLFVEAGESAALVEGLAHELFDGWAQLAKGVLGVAPSRRRAIDVRWLDAVASAYVSKIGNEITRADMKEGGTVDPLWLLDECDRGDLDAMRSFVEYGNGMFGRHALDWSPGLRKRLGLSKEKTDEELAAAVEDGEVVTFIDGRVWNRAQMQRDENGVPLTVAYLREVERQWLAK